MILWFFKKNKKINGVVWSMVVGKRRIKNGDVKRVVGPTKEVGSNLRHRMWTNFWR